jgi:hypothetical protein
MRRGEAEAVHTCQDLSVGSTAHLSQTTQFKPSRTRLSSTTSMTGNLATFGSVNTPILAPLRSAAGS